MMREKYGLIMFSVGFIGLILTYFLDIISEQLVAITGHRPSSWIVIVFYLLAITLMIFGVVNDRKDHK